MVTWSAGRVLDILSCDPSDAASQIPASGKARYRGAVAGFCVARSKHEDRRRTEVISGDVAGFAVENIAISAVAVDQFVRLRPKLTRPVGGSATTAEQRPPGTSSQLVELSGGILQWQ